MSARIQLYVIGGGAAGFFAAIRCAELQPYADVVILEKSHRCLAKVKVSGGGRCNVTHACFDPRQLVDYYPRGRRHLHGLFHRFGPNETVAWFAERGVKLKTEADGRMFPVTDNSQTIVDCLVQAAQDAGVRIEMNQAVQNFKPVGNRFELSLASGEKRVVDKVLAATGGSPTRKGLDWITDLGVKIVSPVPSLFSFNMRFDDRNNMMGTSVPMAHVTLAGHGVTTEGPLLFTHWGMSGPAILRLSAEAAPLLAELSYRFTIRIGWAGEYKEESLREELASLRDELRLKHGPARRSRSRRCAR